MMHTTPIERKRAAATMVLACALACAFFALSFPVRGAALEPDLVFFPDPGLRIDNASNVAPSVGDDGLVYLFYSKHTGEQIPAMHGQSMVSRHERMMSWSRDGLSFKNHAPWGDSRYDMRLNPHVMKMPDGTYKQFQWDMREEAIVSMSSRDGRHFKRDPGIRYRGNHSGDPCEEDNNSIGITDFFRNRRGDIVLLYLGDNRGPYDSVRRAVSRDNGESFSFDRGNVLGDCHLVRQKQNHVDQKHIRLPGGRIRLFTMVGGGPARPGVSRCCSIYSWISEDDGETFTQEPGVRLAPLDFTDLDVYSLHDPFVVRLHDGRYRMYVTARILENGQTREAIVSATTRTE